jgi:hypothetical protein
MLLHLPPLSEYVSPPRFLAAFRVRQSPSGAVSLMMTTV